MINITFFNIPHLSYGRGGEVWEKEVIEFLNNAGFKAKLITTNWNYKYDVHTNFDYKIIDLKYRYGLFLYDFNEIKEDFEDADLIYYMLGIRGSELPLILHKNKFSKKVIFGHHGPIRALVPQIFDKNKKEYTDLKSRIIDYLLTSYDNLYYSIVSIFLKKLGYHHSLTHYYAKMLEKKGFMNVFVLPNFIDLQKYRPRTKEPKFTISAVGVTHAGKGLETLVEVGKKLEEIGANVNIYLTGWNLPKNINLPTNIQYLGFVSEEEKIDLLASSHVCFLPTRSEMFPLTLLECLATGNLVVARDLPQLREASGNINSVAFAKTSEEFIRHILEFKELFEKTPEKYYELSSISIERAKNFDKNKILEKFARQLITIYNTIK